MKNVLKKVSEVKTMALTVDRDRPGNYYSLQFLFNKSTVIVVFFDETLLDSSELKECFV